MNYYTYLKTLRAGIAHDATAFDESLAEHDKKYHPDGFDPEHETCNKRAELAKADKGDVLSPSEGAEKGCGDKPLVSAAEDAAYMDAVKRGDMETAAKMVREVAESKLLKEIGDPEIKTKPVRIGRYMQIPLVRAFNGVKDGSGKLRYVSLVINEDPAMGEGEIRVQHDDSLSGALFLNVKDSDSVIQTVYNENGTYNHGELRLGKIAEELKQGLIHFAARDKGLDLGPVTYDDDGNVIPLSRRFDGGDDIRGNVSGGNHKKG